MKKSLIGFACMLAAGTTNASIISTTTSENSAISTWGLPDTSAYGQTFNLTSSALLDSVLFRINDMGTAITYDLNVFAWSGTQATGTSLASVSGITAGANGMADVQSSLGGLALDAGDYVAFFQATSSGSAFWGSVNTFDAYSGGEFVFQNNNGNTSLWTTGAWSSDWQGVNYDLAFELDFTPQEVPEPSALVLMGLGLAGLGVARRRKFK